jgi:hypothetical protein
MTVAHWRTITSVGYGSDNIADFRFVNRVEYDAAGLLTREVFTVVDGADGQIDERIVSFYRYSPGYADLPEPADPLIA